MGVLGFSQGVATAFQMVRRDPARFAYAVNLSGGVVPLPGRGDAELAARRLPVFWGRGDRDPLIPALLVESTRWWLRRHTDLTERVYPGLSHNVSPAELADLAAFVRARICRGPDRLRWRHRRNCCYALARVIDLACQCGRMTRRQCVRGFRRTTRRSG